MAVADLSDVLDPGAIKSNPLAPSGASPTSDAAPASKPDEPPKKEAPPEKRPPPPTAGEGVATEVAARQNQIIEAQNMRFRPPDMKLPEKPPPRDEFGPRMWAALAIGVAALGSRMTQQPITAALNGAAGALQGYQEGKMEDFDRSMKVWERESQNAITLANYQKDVYKSILDESHYAQRTNLQAGEAKDYVKDHATEAKLKAAFIAHGDTIGLQTLENEGVPGVAKLQNFREEKIDDLKRATARMGDKGAEYAMFRGIVKDENDERARNGIPAMSSREVIDMWNKQQQEKKYGKGFETPQQEQDYERNILDYKESLPSGRQLQDPTYKRLANRVKANPDYDESMRKSVQDSEVALSKGKEGAQKAAYGTVIQHTNTIEALAKQLQGTGDVRVFNSALQAWGKQLGNNTAITNFESAKELIGGEIAKAAVGATGGGVTEREHFRHLFDAAQTPEQLQGVINTVRGLVADQAVNFKARWSMFPQWFQNKYFDPAVFGTYDKYANSVHGKVADDFKATRQQEGVAPGTSAQNPLTYHNVQQLLAIPDSVDGGPWVADDKGKVKQLTPAVKQWLREHLHDGGEAAED